MNDIAGIFIIGLALSIPFTLIALLAPLPRLRRGHHGGACNPDAKPPHTMPKRIFGPPVPHGGKPVPPPVPPLPAPVKPRGTLCRQCCCCRCSCKETT